MAAIAGMAEAAGKEVRALPRWRMLLVDRRRTCRAATAGRGASSRAAFAQTGAWSPSLGQLGMRVCRTQPTRVLEVAECADRGGMWLEAASCRAWRQACA